MDFFLDRGFIGEVQCSVKFFIEAGAALMKAAPVIVARFEGLTARYVAKLAKCKHFAKLRTLVPIGVLHPWGESVASCDDFAP